MTSDAMGPGEFFQDHPVLYWLALAAPVLTAAYSLVRMRQAADPRQARRHAALAAVTAAKALALARIRPSASARQGQA
jgi:hypothetical protein